MQVCLGDQVWTNDAHKAGTVEWMLLDPTAQRVNAVVIRRGLILRHSLVVPLTELQVVEMDEQEERLVIRRSRAELDLLPEFRRELFTGALAWQLTGERATPFFLPGWLPPVTPQQPPPSTEVVELGELVRTIDQANAVLHRGAAIVAADGQRIGHLQQLCAELPGGQVIRVTARPGLSLQEIEIPVGALSGADDGLLFLRWWRQDFEQAMRSAR